MKKYISIILSILIIFSLFCYSGCEEKEPIVLTLWHVYGGQADSPLNILIDEFNETVGEKENIQIQVTSVTNTNTIHENVLAAAFKDPGAPTLPDMFISYPKTVLAMPDKDILVDYNDYFSEEEIREFVPAFIEEGMIEDTLSVLPVAKSTEVMFVNKTAFDRFAQEKGFSIKDLSTWEGLFKIAVEYTKETGKPFLAHDYHFNYFQVGMESLGEDFFIDGEVNFSDGFERVWNPYAKAALSGAVWLKEGYATEPLRTGDSIVTVASSASVLYYSDEVTYPDNTSEQVEIIALPVPVFENGTNLVMQRGAGMCTVRSTKEREEAAMIFLRWLTDERHNVDFVTTLGYLPVKKAAFSSELPLAVEKLQNPMYISLYETFINIEKEYEFYTPPKISNYLDLETRFESQIRRILSSYVEENLTQDDINECYNEFKKIYMQ